MILQVCILKRLHITACSGSATLPDCARHVFASYSTVLSRRERPSRKKFGGKKEGKKTVTIFFLQHRSNGGLQHRSRFASPSQHGRVAPASAAAAARSPPASWEGASPPPPVLCLRGLIPWAKQAGAHRRNPNVEQRFYRDLHDAFLELGDGRREDITGQAAASPRFMRREQLPQRHPTA